MARKTYVYPKFSTLGVFGFRTGGPGLANLFFPYARALVLAKRNGWTLINPSWPTVKIGPILRRERDARLYLRVFRPGGVAGLRKTWLLLTRRKVSEAEAQKGNVPPGAVALTSGLGNFFKDISADREYLAHAMSRILLPADKERIRARGPYGIGVHIRLGDFQAHQRIPISWYVATIAKIRAAVGADVPVAVASDGSDEELQELLDLPGVRRTNMNAVCDIFALSSCKIILASNSTFSAWAAFLGHIPILWARRTPELEGIFVDGTPDEVLDAEAPLPPQVAGYLQQAFADRTQT